MEHVALIVERGGRRIDCLLNPESLVMRRLAGIEPRASANGALTGAGLADDPLIYTGGGRTELDLDLLFDVTLVPGPPRVEDVRKLTDPLRQLAENSGDDDGYGRPPQVRFVWGKAWSIPGVIRSLAERLELFTSAGMPRRSWLRLRLLRVAGTNGRRVAPAAAAGIHPLAAVPSRPVAEETVRAHEVLGGRQGPVAQRSGTISQTTQTSGQRLDELAERYYGDASLWRLLATFNDIDDPLRPEPGKVIRIPPLSAFKETP